MMLGYTFQHDDAHWFAGIGRRMNTPASQLQPLRIGRWTVPGGIVANPTVGDVLVLHILLPMRSYPDARHLRRNHFRRR